MVDVRFSALAAFATLAVALLAAAQGAWAVAAVFALVSAGFVVRALQGYHGRTRRSPGGGPREPRDR
jgi:membrane protein implicated in regulation of membrane protease activity